MQAQCETTVFCSFSDLLFILSLCSYFDFSNGSYYQAFRLL